MKPQVIIVGAGHAGVEAALASARLGVKTLVVTNRIDRTAFMSCNPSIGGLGKGHIVKEIDALGGGMGLVTDKTCIQFKRLNASRGPAVRGSRAQCDKDLYSAEMTKYLLAQDNLEVLEAEVKSLKLHNNICTGVVLQDDSVIESQCVVITTGTFMRAMMFIGTKQISGGRVGEKATIGISDQLRENGFSVFRLKTGTPPRLSAKSIDWDKTSPQGGDKEFIPFSFLSENKLSLPQISCYLTKTSEITHEIIRKNLKQSALFSGLIEGTGPRYCPSIEDKITRFTGKTSHQTFLEPEGLSTDSIYLQGISTSLPEETQVEFLRTIPGLENVKLLRPGYAVEYDFIEPTQIWHSLETRTISNLFLAGQINGTSGYEEAAGQGLVAGTNAACKVLEKDPLNLSRDESYIGVLIDDLVTKGTKEPYRMFTSRAEHRMVLREDNVLERLAAKANNLGLLPDEKYSKAKSIMGQRMALSDKLKSVSIGASSKYHSVLSELKTAEIKKSTSLFDLLKRVELSFKDLAGFGVDVDIPKNIYEAVEVEIKYEGYIKRQFDIIAKTKKLEGMKLDAGLDYSKIKGLSNEEVTKLSSVKPISIAQAQRISGVNPSAIQSILVYLKIKEAKSGPKTSISKRN